MKLNQLLLNEQKHSIAQIVDILNRDCSKFLKTKTTLYRGVKRKLPDFDKYDIKTNRSPVHTSTLQHNIANRVMTDLFGEPFRDALFATGAYNVAKEYGDVYNVFPIDDFKYLWFDSTDGIDMFIYFESQKFERIIATAKHDHQDSEKIITQIMKTDMSPGGRLNAKFNKDLNQVDGEVNEVMIRGSGYYMVSKDIIDQVMDQL